MVIQDKRSTEDPSSRSFRSGQTKDCNGRLGQRRRGPFGGSFSASYHFGMELPDLLRAKCGHCGIQWEIVDDDTIIGPEPHASTCPDEADVIIWFPAKEN